MRLQVVVAGSQDTWEIYVWSVKTGRLTDKLAGHEGPVAGLAFSPSGPLLASASWDHTLRTWDVFASKGAPPAAHPQTLRTCQHEMNTRWQHSCVFD